MILKPLVRGEGAGRHTLTEVTLCHGEHYVGELRHIAPSSGLVYIDGDTSMRRRGTWEAVMRGVGGAVAATDAVMSGTHHNGFVAVRPPGHHAEVSKPDGLLLLRQRRDRRASRPAQIWHPSVRPSSIFRTSITATAPRISSGPIRP